MDWGPPSFDRRQATWDYIDSCHATSGERARAYLSSLSDAELHADRDFDIDGQTLAYAPAELLGNLVIHERGHHGDINTLFYQLGLQPPDA